MIAVYVNSAEGIDIALKTMKRLMAADMVLIKERIYGFKKPSRIRHEKEMKARYDKRIRAI